MTDRRSILDHDDNLDANVFGDEYAVEDWGMVADGFRPGHSDDTEHTREESPQITRQTAQYQPSPDFPPITSISAHYATPSADTVPRLSISRNSIRKERPATDNPFSSPDDTHHDNNSEPLLSFEPQPEHRLRRSMSSSSTRQFASGNIQPFSAGPSHPYGMYPQGTMGRATSVASSSAIPPLPQHNGFGRGGPAHPYAMYPQGIVADIEDHDEHITTNPVPLGFLGAIQTYHRQVGPDGEEQDIIGALGHTEQLPPYSRYPEDAPEKMPLLVPEAPRASHSRAPVMGSDPTMPLMHTAMALQPTPEPQSMTDESNLVRSTSRSSRHSRRSQHSVSAASMSSGSHLSWSEKNWRQRRRTRFCRIPFWLWCVLLLVIVFVGSVLGGIVGGFVEGSRKHRIKPQGGPATSLYDASAIATPTNAPPPTGTFKLQLSTPTEVRNGCLVNFLQVAAWSCNLAGDPAAAIGIGTAAGSNRTGAYLYYASNDSQVYYGAQAAYLQTNFAPFLTVIDNDNPANGPAYYFQQFYDKLVVVPEFLMNVATSATGQTTGKIKRDFFLDPSWLIQKTVIKPGSRPWFCVWNQTFVEGFIYVQQNIVVNTFSISSASPTQSASSAVVSSGPIGSSTAPPAGGPVTATITLASTTATFTGAASQLPAWSSSVAAQQKPYRREASARPEPRSNLMERDSDWDSLPLFPHLVKIEERRLPDNPYQPYCQQYQILDNNQYNNVVDNNGNPIIVYLNEKDPTYTAYQVNKVVTNGATSKLSGREELIARAERGEVMDRRELAERGLGGLLERAESNSACHCQWLSGQ